MLHLTDNPWLVGLLLVYLLIDVVAFRPSGLLNIQVGWLRDTHSLRTFDHASGAAPYAMPLLLVQVFLFFGLSLYVATDVEAARHLAQPDSDTWLSLLYWVGIPSGWFLLQWAMVGWFGFLFGETERVQLFNRAYLAIHLLSGPLALVVFLASIIVPLSPGAVFLLLIVLFITVTVFFIFSGFKIFFGGIGSLFLIFAYLCALEIAPLAVLYAKLLQ